MTPEEECKGTCLSVYGRGFCDACDHKNCFDKERASRLFDQAQDEDWDMERLRQELGL